jgi:hypothetical protein
MNRDRPGSSNVMVPESTVCVTPESCVSAEMAPINGAPVGVNVDATRAAMTGCPSPWIW